MEDLIFEKVEEIVFGVLEPSISRSQITAEAKLADDLGADSLDVVEMLMACEEEFNLDISDKDMENIATVQDIVDYIHKGGGKIEKAMA